MTLTTAAALPSGDEPGPTIAYLCARFAQAISYRVDVDATYLDADNKAAGIASIDEAARSGRPFFVPVDIDILAIDMDDPKQRPALNEIRQSLVDAGEHPVLVASGGQDRVHLLARVHDGALHERLAERARRGGLDVRQFIRPPLVPHRLGYASRLIDPINPEDAIAALALRVPRRRRDLPPDLNEILLNGGAGRYRSRSEAALAIAVSAVNWRWLYREFESAMQNNPGGAKYKGRRDEEKQLRTCWTKATRIVRLHPPAPPADAATRALIRKFWVEVQQMKWSGRAGATDLSVLKAHFEVAHRVSSASYSASDRQIAESAKVERETVSRSHKRLRALDITERVTEGRSGKASKWRLKIASLSFESPSTSLGSSNFLTTVGGVRPISDRMDTFEPSHDVFRSSKLTLVDQRVYELLDRGQDVTVSGIAATLKGKPPGVSKHLRRLEQYGLAQRAGRLWRRGPKTLEELARELGVAEKTRRQHERHVEEREQWAEKLRQHAEQRKPSVAGTVGPTMRGFEKSLLTRAGPVVLPELDSAPTGSRTPQVPGSKRLPATAKYITG